MEREIPKRLFRYFPPGASDILAEKKLWFSAPADFNDPFEAMPDLTGVAPEFERRELQKHYCFSETGEPWHQFAQRNAMPDELRQKACQEAQSNLQCTVGLSFRIVCFAPKEDRIPMWAYYADHHAGFVIEFDVSHLPLDRGVISRVRYDHERPPLPPPGQGTQPFFVKSDQWHHEDEWRLVVSVNQLTAGRKRISYRDGKGVEEDALYLPLAPPSIKAVFLGCRMLQKSPLRHAELLSSLKEKCYCKVQAFRMELSTSEYTLVPKSLAR